MYKLLSFVFLMVFALAGKNVRAQPLNDDCDQAVLLSNVQNYCSAKAEFTNVAGTTSSVGAASCFSGGADVWFRFVATATDGTVTVRGDDPTDSGGSLQRPEVAIYTGVNCTSLTEVKCDASSVGSHVVSSHLGALVPGKTYYIRVQGNQGKEGTFQLCVTNYNPPFEPGQDCPVGSYLCSKTPFTVQKINGAGNNPNEVSPGSCLGTESSSTWFRWVAATSGTLTFTLIPTNAPDDLDFLVYELPNGVNDCSGKIVKRCMGAGAYGTNATSQPCYGATGLREGSNDVSEPAGCPSPNDNWLKPLDMVAGKAYALMVNNFSDSGAGFNIEFGGTGEFKGPDVDFMTNQPGDKACVGETFIVSDNSNYPTGTITSWEWTFGIGASTPTANGQGPYNIVYDSPGEKYISLVINTSEGCKSTIVKRIHVNACCDTYNAMTISENITNLDCYYDSDGVISVTTNTNAQPVSYNWDYGSNTTSTITGLPLGFYNVTITNSATCDTSFVYEITAPEKMEFDTTIVRPTCDGGTDGSLEIQTTGGGVAPYEYNFANTGFTSNNVFANIGNGYYDVVVRDANGCVENLDSIRVHELELLLNSNVVAIDTPKCAGSTDGRIYLGVLNGLPPYKYDFGSGFSSSNVLSNVGAGVYNVVVQDANLCRGDYQFTLPAYPPVTVDLDMIPASCYGLADGSASANAGGGVGDYSYLWSNQVDSSLNVNISSGTYMVTATDGNGCEKVGSIFVDEPNEVRVFDTGIEGVVCYGDETGTVGLDAAGGNSPYLFSIDTSAFQQDSVFINIAGGKHQIRVQDSNGCIGTDSISVPQPEELVVLAYGDTLVNLGFKVPLGAFVLPQGHEVKYQWIPGGDEFNEDTIANPILRPKNTGYYIVQVTDTSGCTAYDSVLVQVNYLKPVYGPTAFSPNGDGRNDFFTIFGGDAALKINHLQIYDRWGNLVYERKNLALGQESVGWDGRIRGKRADTGVYVWVAEVDFWDGTPVLVTGDVTLVR